MAGYIIYSLDSPKFQKMVESPTPKQLKLLANELAEELEELDGEFEEDDPIVQWRTDAKSLAATVAKRLALPDWYADLSPVGKELWETTFYGACMNCDDLDVGFRVDGDGVYWDVIDTARVALGVAPNQVTAVAMSTFGTRPFRYHPPAKRGASSVIGPPCTACTRPRRCRGWSRNFSRSNRPSTPATTRCVDNSRRTCCPRLPRSPTMGGCCSSRWTRNAGRWCLLLVTRLRVG